MRPGVCGPRMWCGVSRSASGESAAIGDSCKLRRVLGREVELEAVILFAQRVLVGVVGFFGGGFGVVDDESGGVPFFPLEHGVVVVGEGFFGADGVDPGVIGLFVGG